MQWHQTVTVNKNKPGKGNTSLSNILCNEMGSTHKTLLLQHEIQWLLVFEEKLLCDSLRCELNSTIYSWNLFFFFYVKEGMTHDRFSAWGIWQTVSWKWVKWVSHFGESKYLVPMIKVLKRKFESWKILSPTMSLTASKYLKTFLMKLVLILISVILCQHLEELHN